MKRPAPRKPPKSQPARIEVRPFANDPQKRLEDILRRIREGGEKNQYCNLSPSECDLLIGSLTATADALQSAERVIHQIACDHYGNDAAENMTVKEFADRQGYRS